MRFSAGGPVAGYRPGVAGPPNGLPETTGTGYRFKGMSEWNPSEGVHFCAADVMPEPGTTGPGALGRIRESQQARKAERFAEFCRLKAEDLRYADIAGRMGVSYATVKLYARQLRESGGGR